MEWRLWNKVDRDRGWGYGRPSSILRRKGADRPGPHAGRSEGRESCQTGRQRRRQWQNENGGAGGGREGPDGVADGKTMCGKKEGRARRRTGKGGEGPVRRGRRRDGTPTAYSAGEGGGRGEGDAGTEMERREVQETRRGEGQRGAEGGRGVR